MKKVKFTLSKNVERYFSKEIQEMKLEFSEPLIQIMWARWSDSDSFEWVFGFSYKDNLSSISKETCIYCSDKFEFFIQEEEWNDRLEGKELDYVNGKFLFT